MNQVTLIGRITHNLVLRETTTGKHYVFFTVAVDGNNKTDYINCVAWNRVAENMSKFVGRGSLIAVAGRISTRKDNRNQNQTITEVSAISVSFLDRRDVANKSVAPIHSDSGSETQKINFEKTNEVNIDEALSNTENYDTEISFVNNSNLDNSDSDDEAIIWD